MSLTTQYSLLSFKKCNNFSNPIFFKKVKIFQTPFIDVFEVIKKSATPDIRIFKA